MGSSGLKCRVKLFAYLSIPNATLSWTINATTGVRSRVGDSKVICADYMICERYVFIMASWRFLYSMRISHTLRCLTRVHINPVFSGFALPFSTLIDHVSPTWQPDCRTYNFMGVPDLFIYCHCLTLFKFYFKGANLIFWVSSSIRRMGWVIHCCKTCLVL